MKKYIIICISSIFIILVLIYTTSNITNNKVRYDTGKIVMIYPDRIIVELDSGTRIKIDRNQESIVNEYKDYIKVKLEDGFYTIIESSDEPYN